MSVVDHLECTLQHYLAPKLKLIHIPFNVKIRSDEFLLKHFLKLADPLYLFNLPYLFNPQTRKPQVEEWFQAKPIIGSRIRRDVSHSDFYNFESKTKILF